MLMVNTGKELIQINTSKNTIEYSTTQGRTWIPCFTGTSCGTFKDLLLFDGGLIAATRKEFILVRMEDEAGFHVLQVIVMAILFLLRRMARSY